MPHIKKVAFSIEGMHCGSCAAGIKMVLQNLNGVTKSSADWEKKMGEVEFDEDKVKLNDILKAVEELGYKAIPQK